jgi:hypothetical protein
MLCRVVVCSLSVLIITHFMFGPRVAITLKLMDRCGHPRAEGEVAVWALRTTNNIMAAVTPLRMPQNLRRAENASKRLWNITIAVKRS